jgi:hypothetical protein
MPIAPERVVRMQRRDSMTGLRSGRPIRRDAPQHAAELWAARAAMLYWKTARFRIGPMRNAMHTRSSCEDRGEEDQDGRRELSQPHH